jgi:hypothetical protein
MQKPVRRTDEPRTNDAVAQNADQPTWRRTSPRGNQEIHRADMDRSTERLEMLLGH